MSYCGPAPLPETLWTEWNFDPILIVALVVAAGVTSRVASNKSAWLAGVLVLAIAFVSPICAWASALFSVRVAHHMLIVALAAPLLVMGTRWRALRAGPAFLAHTAAIWLWHMPPPYAAALGSDLVYWGMELSLLGTAAWLWAALLHPARAGAAIALSLGTLMQMGMLGALLTFAGRPLFAAHLLTTEPFGLTALEDQQLAGLLMWAPAALPYLGFALHRLCRMILPQAHA